MKSKSSIDGGTDTVTKRAAELLHKFKPNTLIKPSQLAIAFRRFRWALVGIDRRVLTKCSKGEQSVYAALSWLMLATAFITATGIAVKAATGLGLGYILTALVWLFAFCFALCLETAVLGTIKPGSSTIRSLLLRAAIGALLVTIQVTPLLTMALKSRIALELEHQSLSAQVSMKSARESIADLKGLTDTAKKLTEDETKATSALVSPPPDAAVIAATKALEAAGGELTSARRAEKAAGTRRDTLRTALAKAKDDAQRHGIESAIARVETTLAKARSRLNTADSAVQNAQTSLKAATEAQQTRLEEMLTVAKQAVAGHAKRLSQVDEALTKDAEYSRALAEKASAANFVTEIVTLLKLVSKDFSVAVMCLIGLLAAWLIDLLPMTVKYSMRNALYAPLVASQDAELLSQCQTTHEASDLEREKELILKRNQVEAVRKFAAEDQGQLAAAKMAIQAQTELDATEVSSSNSLLEACIDDLHRNIQHLIVLEELVAQHPKIETAYRDQLAIMLRDLRTRAESMAEQLRQPGLDGMVGAKMGA